MSTRSKFLVWVFPVLALASVGFGYVSIVESQPHRGLVSPSAPPSEPRGRSQGTIAGLGIVEPAGQQIDVGTIVPGVVEAIKVSVGDKVGAGSQLFVIDTRLVKEEIEIKKADVAIAEARLQQAIVNADDMRDQYERLTNLSVGLSVSDSALARRRYAANSADAATKVAQKALEGAKSQLHAADVLLDVHSVRSPIDGIVLQINIRAGEYAQSVSSSRGLIVLGRQAPLNVRVQIDEAEIGRFSSGMHAYASPRSNPEQHLELRFVQMEPIIAPKKSLTGSATEKTDTRTLTVVYTVEPSEASLLVGQQLDVYFDRPPLAEK